MKFLPVLVSMALVLSSLAEQDAPRPSKTASSDFKLRIALRGARSSTVASAELVVRDGIAYQFIKEMPEEVQIVDPKRSGITLLNLRRKWQAELPKAQLELRLRKLRDSLNRAIEKREQSADRADRLSAAMSRDLVDTRFSATFEPVSNTLSLTNPTAELTVHGTPEPDERRLRLIQETLSDLSRLDAMRNPESLPPFPRMEAIDRLVDGYHLRPKEVSMLLRVKGTPVRLRWTYDLVAELTDREREAIARVEKLRQEVRFVSYTRYDQPEP